MKTQLLSTALLTLICSWAHANAVPTSNTTQSLQPPATPTSATISSLPATPQPLPVVNCEYPIPATTAIDQAILLIWAQKAAIQSFDFNPIDLDAQIEKLKPCFTDQGWQGFRDALDKSGNLGAIKSQSLTVSSQLEGTTNVISVKENQWKVTVPLQVVYQNDKEKLTQRLFVELLIGRKISGDLGIMQVIATPKSTVAATAVIMDTPKIK